MATQVQQGASSACYNPAIMHTASLAAQSTRLNKSQMKLVALMVALSGMSYFDRTIMSIAGPGIMKEFNISETAMGAVYSAFLLSYTICMTPGGWLTDVFAPRRALTASVLGTALLTGLTALCGSPGLGAIFGVAPSFLVVRFLFGITAAQMYTAPGRMAANWTPIISHADGPSLLMLGGG